MGIPADKIHRECKVNSEGLKHLLIGYGELLDDKKSSDIASSIPCDELLLRLIDSSTRLRDDFQTKAENFSKNFTETQDELLKDAQVNAGRLQEIPDEFQQTYRDIYKQASEKIWEIQQQTELELKNQAALGESLDYYSLFLGSKNDSTDTTSASLGETFDYHSLFETSSASCSFFNEKGRKFMSIADEILVALSGEMFDGDCKRLSKKMMNLKSIVVRNEIQNERRFQLMKESFQEHKRIISDSIYDNAQGLRDFDVLRRNSTELPSFLDKTIRANTALKQESDEKAFKYVVKIVQNDRDDENFLEAALIIRKSANQTAYENALREASRCDDENLYRVVKLAEFCGGQGYEVILDEVIRCEKLNHPVLLKLQKELKKPKMDQHVAKIYSQFSEQVRANSTSQVLSVIKRLTDDVFDLPRFIPMVYNRKVENFLAVTSFIDIVEPKANQNLEKVFYDEMMELKQVDTVEHVMFAYWVKKRLHRINNLESFEGQRQRGQLVALKKRLPDGIQNLIFEPQFMIANQDLTPFIRSFGSESVALVAKPSDEGKYFRIENARDGMALFRTRIDSKDVVNVGQGSSTAYYWQIVPNLNAQLFIIKSSVDGFAISSQEHKICLKWESHWYRPDECLQRKKLNLASGPLKTRNTLAYVESQKWIITNEMERTNYH